MSKTSAEDPNIIPGSGGDDTLTGTGGVDFFQLAQGGDDTVKGLGGNDRFGFGDSFTAQDRVDGGAGFDNIRLWGDYNNLQLGANTITDVERFSLMKGSDYNITTDDGNVAAGDVLHIDGYALTGKSTLTLDGSAETDGRFIIVSGAGDDQLTGGKNSDTFFLRHGGTDNVDGGGGNDFIHQSHALNRADNLDGGSGNDTLFLKSGDVTLGAATLVSIENIELRNSHSVFDLTFSDATVGAGDTLNIDGSQLHGSEPAARPIHAEPPPDRTFTLDLRAETDGFYNITGGTGSDTVIFGKPAVLAGSTYDGGGGPDTLKLDGNYSNFTFGANTITNVENITVLAGHNYHLTLDANNINDYIEADASALGANNHLFIDTSAGSIGSTYVFHSGLGGDTFILPSGQADPSSYFYFTDVAQSTSTGFDTIGNFDFQTATLFLPVAANWQSPDANLGPVDAGTFDQDLAGIADTTHLVANHSCLVFANGGSFDGETFLVIDQNGTAGYQANADIVIDVTGYASGDG